MQHSERKQAYKKLLFTDPALQDFQEIHDYIAKDNVDAAADFIARLQKRCNEVIRFPNVGRKRDAVHSEYRSVTEGEYIIFYKLLNEDTLAVMRVIHGKRDIAKIQFS